MEKFSLFIRFIIFLGVFLILNSNSSLIGYIGLVLAVVGWGLSASFISFGLTSINPYFFLTLRFSLAVILFSPYIILVKRDAFIKLLFNKWVWIISFFEFLGLEFQYFGQTSVSAGLATLLSLQFVLFVPFLSVKLLHEPFSKITIPSIIFALTGTLLISTNGKFTEIMNNFNIGGLFLLFSALAYSFYIIFSSKLTHNTFTNIDSSVLFFNIILGVSLFSLFPTIALSSSFSVNQSVWIWIVALAIFSTLIPSFGYFLGLKVVSANTMSLILLFQIIVPFAIDIFFLGITYSSWIIIGCMLVIGSLVIFVSNPLLIRLKLENMFFKHISPIPK